MFDWNTLVEEHGRRVFGIAYRILGSVHDAEDVSQQVFAEAFKLQQTNSVMSWTGLLSRLTAVRAMDAPRRRKYLASLESAEPAVTMLPEESASARELAEWLRESVARLPQQQATVFTLVCLEGFSREDVADALEISSAAVSTALLRHADASKRCWSQGKVHAKRVYMLRRPIVRRKTTSGM